ncbi:MAG: TVP38/TMEM64 family protein [Pseudomonadota bacterium]
MTTSHETVSPVSHAAKIGGLVKRWLPAIVLVGAIGAAFALGLDKYLTLDALREHRFELQAFVAQNELAAIALFVLIYAVSTALSLPGATILTIAGGFLFGIWFGTAYAVIGATIGATGVFLVARTAIGQSLRQRAGPWFSKMEDGFRDNALSYMLVLRLVPLFPFFVVNLVPAFMGISLRVYVLATLIGIIPGAWVYASVGAGLGSIFDSAEEVSLGSVLTPELIAALVGLALLSLAPVVYKKIKRRRIADHG